MDLNFGNKILIISLLVFTILFGIVCSFAADVDNSGNFTVDDYNNLSSSDAQLDCDSIYLPGGHHSRPVVVDNDYFVMTLRGESGSTGYHWVISPETHGVDFVSDDYILDNPDCYGSAGTDYFTFHINSDDYYVKLLLVTPSGDIVKEVDSNMII